VIHTNPDTRSLHIYVWRLGDGTPLTFTGDATRLVDDHAGSTWDPARAWRRRAICAA
jgi:hypothetical protein